MRLKFLRDWFVERLAEAKQYDQAIRADEELQVTSVFDSGDMGGILCAIASTEHKEVFVISLTHLCIHEEHPLGGRIEAFQKVRICRLWRQMP